MTQQISYEAIQIAISDIILYYKERAMNLERCLKKVFNPNLYRRSGDWAYSNTCEATRSRDHNGVFTCYRPLKKRSLRQAVVHFITGMDYDDIIRELPEGSVHANAFAIDHDWAWTIPKRQLRVTSQDYIPIHEHERTARAWENFSQTISLHETEIRTMLETASVDDSRGIDLMPIAAGLINILWREGKRCHEIDETMKRFSDLEAKLIHKDRFSNHT